MLSDDCKIPVSKYCKPEVVEKLYVLWTGQSSDKRFIAKAIPYPEIIAMFTRYMDEMDTIFGPNFASFLLAFGHVRLQLTRKFFGDRIKIGTLNIYGEKQTGESLSFLFFTISAIILWTNKIK